MKKFLILMSLCFLPVLTGAQSTCETRVDAHQRATTKQRVAYCLTPDAVAVDNTYTGLVFSGVSAHYPSTEQPADTSGAKAKDGEFKPEQVAVSRNYVGTAQFPQVFNDDASEVVQVTSAVRGSTKPAVTMASEPLQQETEILVPVEHFMIDEKEAEQENLGVHAIESEVGIRTRQTKPARRLMVKTTQPQPDTEAVSYTYREELPQSNQTEIPVGTQSYAPATQTPAQVQEGQDVPPAELNPSDLQNVQSETATGASSYAPATSN